MSCDAVLDRVAESVVESAGLDDATRAHLASCPECSAAAEELAALWRELGHLPPHPVDDGRIAELVRKGRRLLPSRNRRRWVAGFAYAAVLLAGVLIGYQLDVAASGTNGDSYLLLLHESPTSDSAALVEEYRVWARRLAESGRLIGAEKLANDGGRWVAPKDAPPIRSAAVIGGYFVVRAASYDEAVQLARSGPHVRNGGIVEVRAIDSGRP